MTVTSTIATLTNSIAALSITGITVKDIDEIPDSAQMLTPLLIPDPAQFVTNYNFTFESFGSNGAAKMNSRYTLNYVFLLCEVGSGVNSFAPFASLISGLEKILKTIFSNDAITGAVDLSFGGIMNIGAVQDPAGNEFWAVAFALNVLEYNQ